MVRLTKKQLMQVSKTVDSRNPKFELNFLLVDSENVVSTNTRALSIIKHNQNVDEKFYIAKGIIDIALKIKKGFFFNAHQDGISVYDFEEMFIVGIVQDPIRENFHFPDYTRIIPKDHKITFKFFQKTNISGLLLANNVLIDTKYIPDIDEGEIAINGSNLPVVISDYETNLSYICMPVYGIFEDKKNVQEN